jgi:magnesium-transporting ATPase (P-type)
MDNPPRNLKEPLLSRKLLIKGFLWYGLLASLASAASYLFVNMQNGWPGIPLAGEDSQIYIKATTMTLAAIVFCQIGAVFNCRTEKQSVFKIGLFSNKRINIGIVVEVILIFLLVYLPPLQRVFHTAPLNAADWLFLCIWPPVILFIEECRKVFLRKK